MQQKIYRVKGIIRSSQVTNIWNALAEIDFSVTPTLRFTRTFQDMKCDKQIRSGKKRRKRKEYGRKAFIELKSPCHSDMEMAHDVLSRYFLPGKDSSNL